MILLYNALFSSAGEVTPSLLPGDWVER